MRLILPVLLLFTTISKCQNISVTGNKMEVILQFLDEEFTKEKTDLRMFLPPPPPESDDGHWYSGKMKPDSVVKNLKPLTFYVNDSVWFDTDFKPKKELLKGYDFVKDNKKSSHRSKTLDITTLSKRNGIILKSVNLHEFKKILPSIRYQNDYGGLVSFQNLFFSEDGNKAYFEINLFKGKLNAGINAIYAEWRNGKWHYTEQSLSIS